MLSNRLKGTTEAPASDRCEQPSLHPRRTTTELDRRTIFARHDAPIWVTTSDPLRGGGKWVALGPCELVTVLRRRFAHAGIRSASQQVC
jgi:hypothetical protein